jgi:hypothetical protein
LNDNFTYPYNCTLKLPAAVLTCTINIRRGREEGEDRERGGEREREEPAKT